MDVEKEAQFMGQSTVFILPVVIIKAEDKEVYRFARSFFIYEVLDKSKKLNGK